MNPTKFTEQVAETICNRLAEGCDLEDICRQLADELGDDAPKPRTVRGWVPANEQFALDYQAAREAGEYAIASRARKTARGKGVEEGGDSTKDTHRDKLIIETDLKLLAKFNPKRWGDRVDLGGVDDSPLRVVIRRMSPDA